MHSQAAVETKVVVKIVKRDHRAAVGQVAQPSREWPRANQRLAVKHSLEIHSEEIFEHLFFFCSAAGFPEASDAPFPFSSTSPRPPSESETRGAVFGIVSVHHERTVLDVAQPKIICVSQVKRRVDMIPNLFHKSCCLVVF